MEPNRVLSLLGLALRGGNLVVGEEPVEAVARARDARLLLLASDAADNTRRRVEHFAAAGQCLWLRIPFSKAELGQAVGRRSCAIVAVTDVGLAAAVAHRLADMDPVRYDEAAAKLDLKAQRAAERKAEQAAHEKNVRQGRKKAKSAESAPAAAPVDEPEKKAPAKSAKGTAPKRMETGRPYKQGKPVSVRKGNRPDRAERAERARRQENRNRFAGSRPVKKGKGSFRKKES